MPVKRLLSFTFLVALTLWVSPTQVAANDIFKDYKVQSSSIETPKRGSLKGDFDRIGLKALNQKTGSFTLTLPLEFPSARGKMIHPYSVNYSPGFGLSEYGIGWNNSLSIQRFRIKGLINFKDDSLMGPWGKMHLGDDGLYYDEALKNKVTARIADDQSTIEAFLTSGEKLIFTSKGSLKSAGLTSSSNESKSFRWFLTKVIDPAGNRNEYFYQTTKKGQVVVSDIFYAGRENDEYQYKVHFDYHKCGKKTVNCRSMLDFSSGKKVSKNLVTKSISFYSLNNNAFEETYHYDLTHTVAADSPAFYLESIQRVMKDGTKAPKNFFKYNTFGNQ